MPSWRATVPGRPITRSNHSDTKVGSHDWTESLRQEMAKTDKRASGNVRARIRCYIHRTKAQPDGDLDNYAKTILDVLRKGPTAVLEDDKCVDGLRITRHLAKPDEERVSIRLRW